MTLEKVDQKNCGYKIQDRVIFIAKKKGFRNEARGILSFDQLVLDGFNPLETIDKRQGPYHSISSPESRQDFQT